MTELVNPIDARHFANNDMNRIDTGDIHPACRTILDTYAIEAIYPVRHMDFAEYERYIKSLNL